MASPQVLASASSSKKTAAAAIDDYFTPQAPGSFSGLTTYARHSNAKLNELGSLLSGYDAFTRHRPIRRRFPREKTLVGGKDDTWSIDLADTSDLKNFNNQTRFLLCSVDILSKYAFVQLT